MGKEIYNINKHIKRELYNEYKGSERKKTVLLDDGKKYMLKLSDPIREKGRNVSYINNAYSEYLGCKIAEIIGLPVQNVILGNYTYVNDIGENHTRPAVLCEDLRADNEMLLEIDTLSLSNYEDTTRELTFSNINNKINHIKGIDTSELKEFYYNMFIFDALTGNTDRHNGNWGLITDKFSTYLKIAPIYDCGSSLLPLLGDNELPIKNKESVYFSICSIILEDKEKINYLDYIVNTRNPDVDAALLRMIPNINLNKINDIIIDTPVFSNNRKVMYSEFIDKRYNNILVPALQNIFITDKSKNINIDGVDLFSFYKNNIESVAKAESFIRNTYIINEKKYELMRINKKYAIFIENDICSGLLPIRSNDKEVSKAISILCKRDDSFSDYIKDSYINDIQKGEER